MQSYKQQAVKALQERIDKLKADASKLENQRGLGALEATDNVSKAKQLRIEARYLENNFNSFEVQAWLVETEANLQLKDGHKQDKARQEFSNMQSEILGAETARNARIEEAMNNLSFNTAVGVGADTIKRQVGKLLDGHGDTDAKGNRFVTFTEGRNSPTFRAVVTPTGSLGIITAGMSSDGE